MNLLNSIPYEVGSNFEENNVSLEFLKEFNEDSKYYASYRYSELYLFGRAFQAVCYLHFWKGVLNTIQYKIHKENFDLFRNSLNEELPIDKPLSKDPYSERFALESYSNGVAISLVQLNNNYFMLKISKNASLPRIKSSKTNRL
ncbi:hypothetical protein [Leeuwenhoekiella sp. W20_SRS_FM14]|uniref:hypothetical protein n=1 Tax=Leeuwenhoekiella sp. W20_SRS_FM14 TaxID=3240270 RepID=UPI003F9E7399